MSSIILSLYLLKVKFQRRQILKSFTFFCFPTMTRGRPRGPHRPGDLRGDPLLLQSHLDGPFQPSGEVPCGVRGRVRTPTTGMDALQRAGCIHISLEHCGKCSAFGRSAFIGFWLWLCPLTQCGWCWVKGKRSLNLPKRPSHCVVSSLYRVQSREKLWRP